MHEVDGRAGADQAAMHAVIFGHRGGDQIGFPVRPGVEDDGGRVPFHGVACSPQGRGNRKAVVGRFHVCVSRSGIRRETASISDAWVSGISGPRTRGVPTCFDR